MNIYKNKQVEQLLEDEYRVDLFAIDWLSKENIYKLTENHREVDLFLYEQSEITYGKREDGICPTTLLHIGEFIGLNNSTHIYEIIANVFIDIEYGEFCINYL